MELTEEEYDLSKMKRMRYEEIEKAREGKHWGIALGTLGRQGNEKILERLKEILERKKIVYDVILISELSNDTVKEIIMRYDV